MREGEGQSVRLRGGRSGGRRLLRGKEAMHGAARQPEGGCKALGQLHGADQAVERSAWALSSEPEQELLHLLRDRPGPPGIGAGAWLEAVKSVGLVQLDPVAHPRAADAAAITARDPPLLLGNGAQQLLLLARRRRPPDQLGNDAVAKQRDLLFLGLIHGTKSPQSDSEIIPKPPAVASWQNPPMGSYQPMERSPAVERPAGRGGTDRSPRRGSTESPTRESAAAASANPALFPPRPAPPATSAPPPHPAVPGASRQTAPVRCAAIPAPAAPPHRRSAPKPRHPPQDAPHPSPPRRLQRSNPDTRRHPPARS